MDEVVQVAKLDAAVIALARADRDDDAQAFEAAVLAIGVAWVALDEREQLCKLHYFREDTSYGASLRAALALAATQHDLGECGANYAAMKGRPWTT